MPTLAHLHERPSWLCRACGEDWPCESAQTGLIEEYRYDRTGLHMYLGELLVPAIGDLAMTPGFSAEMVYKRFLAWAGPLESDGRPAWARESPPPAAPH